VRWLDFVCCHEQAKFLSLLSVLYCFSSRILTPTVTIQVIKLEFSKVVERKHRCLAQPLKEIAGPSASLLFHSSLKLGAIPSIKVSLAPSMPEV